MFLRCGQGLVVVMTDADWDGDVKDRRSHSGVAVWVKVLLGARGVPKTRFPRGRTWFV